MRKINMTFNIEDEQVNGFDNWIRTLVDVIDFKVIPDTTELYESDNNFKSLCKAKKDLQLKIDRYVNDKNIRKD